MGVKFLPTQTTWAVLFKLIDGTTIFAQNVDYGGIEYDVWPQTRTGEPFDGGFVDNIGSAGDLAQNTELLCDIVGNSSPIYISQEQIVCVLRNEDAEQAKEDMLNH